MCLHALNLSFEPYYTIFMRDGYQVKPMILGPVLAIRKVLVTFLLFPLVLLQQKPQKFLLRSLFCFVLVSVHVQRTFYKYIA
jgi:hypothetical protein